MRKLLFALCTLLMAARGFADDGGFLFVGYKGDSSPTAEQVHFSLSSDRTTWEALNQAEPVQISSVGEKGVRDPFLSSGATRTRRVSDHVTKSLDSLAYP